MQCWLRKMCLVVLVGSAAVNVSSLHAAPRSSGLAPVQVNGVQLTIAQWRTLEVQLGGTIAPGQYLLNAQGCWLNMTTGASGCLNAGGAGSEVHSRYGSGSRAGAGGSWNHWSNAAGGAVGGTGDGCIYTTFGWSNC